MTIPRCATSDFDPETTFGVPPSDRFIVPTEAIVPPTLHDDDADPLIVPIDPARAAAHDNRQLTSNVAAFAALDYTVAHADGRTEHVAFDVQGLRSFMASPEGQRLLQEGDDDQAMPEAEIENGEPLTRLSQETVNSYPWKVMGRLALGCAATLVGVRQLITAAHCVYDTDTDKFYVLSSLRFSRARYGNNHGGIYDADRVYVPDGYTKQHKVAFDYALIILKEPVAPDVGRLPFGVVNDDWFAQYKVNINGYPAYKGRKMYRSRCTAEPRGTQRMLYNCTTLPGMSGSSVYMAKADPTDAAKKRRVIYGVHHGGFSNTQCRYAHN